MIEKIISAGWNIQSIFDSPTKFAAYEPETHVPPEIEEFARNLQPDPRFNYIHTIAMSDGGRYGSNLNGDIFRADELKAAQTQREADKNPGDMQGIPVPRFKTFEMAKFYRHHANSPIDPHYGDLPLSVWNEPMRRVELIIRVFREPIPELNGSAAPDIIVKLDQRGYITVSMGCRIHHEQCMYCGNENEYVSQRCDCLRNHMNEIMPDGRLVAADNFEPRFFDLSDVSIPADPIAFSLNKVASLWVPQRAKVANMARDIEIKAAWSRKLSEMDKQVPGGIGTMSSVPPEGASTAERLPSNKEMKTNELKQALALAGDLETLVSTATMMGIVLSPRELAELTTLAEPEKVGSAEENFTGLRNLSLDNFSVFLYDFLKTKFADRSGYRGPCPMKGWEPTKIAESGYEDVADYYSFYRRLLANLPIDGFIKAAHRNPYVRELLGDNQEERYTRIKAAMYHLAHAGMATV